MFLRQYSPLNEIVAVLSFLFPSQFLSAQSYIPEVGLDAIYQRSLDLNSGMHVLSIALQPGFEDLGALAYLRFGRGAKIMSAYVTNGEQGENDVSGEYPPFLAAIRREEAAAALQWLNGDAYFLNMPDIASARDTAQIREQWQRDSLQLCFMRLISNFRPDLIIIARDWEADRPSLRWTEMLSDLLVAVNLVSGKPSGQKLGMTLPFSAWSVSRVVFDGGSSTGMLFPSKEQHPRWKKSYSGIGEEAAERYRSLHVQRELWRRGKQPSYALLLPKEVRNLRVPDQGLPERVTKSLQSLAQQIEFLSRATIQWTQRGQVSLRGSQLLVKTADLIDSVDQHLRSTREFVQRDRKVLVQWKESLENFRTAALGVSVRYTLSERIVTDYQLTFLEVDSVAGLSKAGETELFFPAVGSTWLLNEASVNRLPLKTHEQIRLLVKNARPYNTPHWLYGLQDQTLGRPFSFLIIHRAKKREESFFQRVVLPIDYAPRFSAEVLTPFVRVIPNERLAFRLTNHSRDGVRDEIHSNDSLVASSRRPFRLNQKEASYSDTLVLNWKRAVPDGSYALPLKIGSTVSSGYAARSFPVLVDSLKRIGIIPRVEFSPTLEALRRLGLHAQILSSDSLREELSSLGVVILDRRALTFHSWLQRSQDVFQHFVEGGGHLVILSQDAPTWNAQPLLAGLTLERSSSFSVQPSFVLDTVHAAILSPNNLKNEDWSSWLYRKAFNAPHLASKENMEILVSDAETGAPLVVSKRLGKGHVTYLELDLEHQWMNIHAGAFRLFANILAQ